MRRALPLSVSSRVAFFADTLALLAFFTVTGLLNERFVASMSWGDVLAARAIGASQMVLTAGP